MHVKPHHAVDELRVLVRKEPRARMLRRLQAVLAAREGETADAIAARVQLSDRAVHTWVTRYNASGLAGLAEGLPRPGNDQDRLRLPVPGNGKLICGRRMTRNGE